MVNKLAGNTGAVWPPHRRAARVARARIGWNVAGTGLRLGEPNRFREIRAGGELE